MKHLDPETILVCERLTIGHMRRSDRLKDLGTSLHLHELSRALVALRVSATEARAARPRRAELVPPAKTTTNQDYAKSIVRRLHAALLANTERSKMSTEESLALAKLTLIS